MTGRSLGSLSLYPDRHRTKTLMWEHCLYWEVLKVEFILPFTVHCGFPIVIVQELEGRRNGNVFITVLVYTTAHGEFRTRPSYGTFTLHWTGNWTGTGAGTGSNGLLYNMQNCSHCTRRGTGTGTWKFVNGFSTHFSGPEIFPRILCNEFQLHE